MLFLKVIAYILLSIGVCTVVLAGIAAIGKKETNNNRKYTSIIGHVLFLFGKSSVFVHVMGNTRYFPTSLFDSNCRNYDHAIKKKLVCTANAYASKTARRSNK